MKISEIIHGWYKKNQRDLPWRHTKEPYYIWISEVILQQTRVNQGLSYYNSFIDSFPDVPTLANAGEDEILKLWQGLGYYSRARNMHLAAKQVMEEYNGIFPCKYEELLRLKGIGPYTAAAISSISSGEKVALVDGNVARVLSRLFLVEEAVNSSKGKRIVKELADNMMDENDPGMHNQALMEFGALQCVPANPSCTDCPLNQLCMARKENREKELPVKFQKKKPLPRYFIYLVINNGIYTYITKRREQDIWKELYEFPLIEVESQVKENEYASLIKDYLEVSSDSFQITGMSEEYKHILSHRIIFARFIKIRILNGHVEAKPEWEFIHPDDLEKYPVPRLIEKYLEEQG